MLSHRIQIALLIAVTLSVNSLSAQETNLLDVLKDKNAKGTNLWIYNNLQQGRAVAKRQDKPLLVTFRCVPCKDCAGFDAEVAKGSGRIKFLARESFVSVRQVEMKGVDLSQFQFDYDLNWAAMFINADGTVYGRYGTQSAAGPDAYNSVSGLVNTMKRVLKLHAKYPANRAELVGKRGRPKSYKTAMQMPGLRNKNRYRNATTRKNCIHCHNIHDAENEFAQSRGKLTHDKLWRYPLPDNVGIKIDAVDGVKIRQVLSDSAAARAGLKRGDSITHMNGQAIASIADMQWVLHGLSNKKESLVIRTEIGGERKLALAKGWKRSDISWRGSLWSVQPRLRVWTPLLRDNRRRSLKLAKDALALEVRWINTGSKGGRAARQAGLRQGDVVVGIQGKKLDFKQSKQTPAQFNLFIKLNYKVGQELPLVVMSKNGRKRVVRIKLVE